MTKLEKEEFIRSVREALGKRERSVDVPYPPLEEDLVRIEKKAEEVRGRIRLMEPELMDRLAEVAPLRGWHVHRAPSPEDVVDYICDLASRSTAPQVVRSDQEVFQDLDLDTPLQATGAEVTVMAASSGIGAEVLRQRAAGAAMGVTGADYAIAETGSVVVIPRRGLSRLVSLLPPVHVALVRPQDAVEALEDVFVLRRLAYHKGNRDMGSYMNLITGPSRTADIEQKLVVGVHGPVEAHMVLMG